MSNVDLAKSSSRKSSEEFIGRKSEQGRAGTIHLNTVSMEDAFKLAREWEVDRDFSFKFGFPNLETNWVRWIEDNNLDMRPFTTWYDEDGNKLKQLPKLDEDGWYPGWAKIVLYFDGEVIQNTVSSCGNKLFGVLYSHCA